MPLQAAGWSGRHPLGREAGRTALARLSAVIVSRRASASRFHYLKSARFILDNSLLLLAGTMTAMAWANVAPASYEAIMQPLHFWVNDVGMVLFFGLAAKEVFEATLPDGPLSSRRRALSPVAAAAGGMVFPATIYLTFASTLGPADLMRGWAIPCATDIAFSAMIARVIFRKGHPAIPFLLLLAIADDALGLIVLAVFYPSGRLSLPALIALMTAAVLLALWLRRHRTHSFWPYVLGPGSLSWAALYLGGVHPALALAPIVPFMPHSARDLGLFEARKELQADTLSRFEHWWATPVQFVLFLFGLANGGVPFQQTGRGTYYVLAALLVGKPLGILIFSAGARLVGAHLPPGLRARDLLVVGVAASIGFTVSLFFATAAFPGGPALAETKVGAVLSFVAAPLALVVARVLGVGRSRQPTTSLNR
jgi:NhaA family Na+:H+ antiporter